MLEGRFTKGNFNDNGTVGVVFEIDNDIIMILMNLCADVIN